MLREMQDKLLKGQDTMRTQSNKHRMNVECQVNDMVYLKIQPYKIKGLAKRMN